MTMVLAPTKRKADALTEQRKRREAERAERRGKRAERASKDQARVQPTRLPNRTDGDTHRLTTKE